MFSPSLCYILVHTCLVYKILFKCKSSYALAFNTYTSYCYMIWCPLIKCVLDDSIERFCTTYTKILYMFYVYATVLIVFHKTSQMYNLIRELKFLGQSRCEAFRLPLFILNQNFFGFIRPRICCFYPQSRLKKFSKQFKQFNLKNKIKKPSIFCIDSLFMELAIEGLQLQPMDKEPQVLRFWPFNLPLRGYSLDNASQIPPTNASSLPNSF